MAVEIIGSPEDTEEYRCAEKFKQLFENDEGFSADDKIIIIPSFQCYGQNTQDIDILIFGKFISTKTMFFCVIEAKSHTPDALVYEGTKWYAPQKGELKDVTAQNIAQRYSLVKYLKNNFNDAPLISNQIFFYNCKKSDFQEKLEKTNSPVFFGDQNISDFFKNLRFQNLDESRFDKFCKLLTKRIVATKLDRKKVERICKSQILSEQDYYKNLGSQLLIYRGKGGTGKTFRLLNLAYKLYNEQTKRILILTYNRALISDLKRLFVILRIPVSWFDRTIQIKSVHEFMGKLLYESKIKEYDEGYHTNKDIKILLNELKNSIVDLDELKKIKNLLDWDYIMVDESQDWPDEERDLLYFLFNSEKIIVADGCNQLVRQDLPCEWANSIYCKTPSKIIYLKKSLRQASNIVKFLRELCAELNMQELDVESNDEIRGGSIKIIVGDYNSKIHEQLIKENKECGNENIDMLFCTPYSQDSYNVLLSNLGYEIWDETKDIIKKTLPTNNEVLRYLNYKSSRGLEGWIVVNYELDGFYNSMLKNYENTGQLTLQSLEERRQEYANNWLLIPLTRAIHTLVIHLRNKDCFISQKILATAKKFPEFIEIIK